MYKKFSKGMNNQLKWASLNENFIHYKIWSIWAVSAFHGMETTGKLGVAGMENRGKPRVNPGFPAGFL